MRKGTPPDSYYSFRADKKYLHDNGDDRCKDVLFALSHYGNLSLRELFCIYKGDPTNLQKSLLIYVRLKYISIADGEREILEKIISEMRDITTLDISIDDKRSMVRSIFSAYPDSELRLLLTSDGSIAAKGDLFLSPERPDTSPETSRALDHRS